MLSNCFEIIIQALKCSTSILKSKTNDTLTRNISIFYNLKTRYLHSYNFIATIFQPLEHKCYFANLQFKFNFNFSSMIFFWKTLNNAQYSKLKRNSAEMISFCCLIESLFQFNLQSSKKFWRKMASFAFKILYFLRRNSRQLHLIIKSVVLETMWMILYFFNKN